MKNLDIRTVLSADEVRARLKPVDDGRNIYPVPRGGLMAAAYLRHSGVVDDPEDADLILDDIVDSGATRDRYADYGRPFFAIVDKTSAKDKDLGWVVFPWELGVEDAPTDNVVRLLQYIGEDVNRAGLKDTPKRYLKAFKDLTKGYMDDPKDYLARVFDMEGGSDEAPVYGGIVLLKEIEMYSLCEHHLLPFVGRAHVAYIPSGNRVVGISKLARVVDCFARRLQCQEKLTAQIADAIEEHLNPLAVSVVIEAEHFCIRMRGVGKQNSVMVTSEMRGLFKDDSNARQELMHLMDK